MAEKTSTIKKSKSSILEETTQELESKNSKSVDSESEEKSKVNTLEDTSSESLIQMLASKVNASLKSDILMVGDQVEGDKNVPYWIKTGIPALDYAIGGDCHPGLPGARIIEIHGSEATGKSTIALHILKRAIEQVRAIAYYQDAERVLTPEIIRGTQIDMKRVIKMRRNTPSFSYGDISRNKVSA